MLPSGRCGSLVGEAMPARDGMRCVAARRCMGRDALREGACVKERGARRRRMAGMPWRAVGWLWETESARSSKANASRRLEKKRKLPERGSADPVAAF